MPQKLPSKTRHKPVGLCTASSQNPFSSCLPSMLHLDKDFIEKSLARCAETITESPTPVPPSGTRQAKTTLPETALPSAPPCEHCGARRLTQRNPVEQPLVDTYPAGQLLMGDDAVGAQLIQKKVVGQQLVALDATCGNGHDTLFLARLVAKNMADYPTLDALVVGFDIQEQALASTSRLLQQESLLQVARLYHVSHDTLMEHMPAKGVLAVAMYNLGYLPGGDKGIATQAHSTLASLQQATDLLMPGGAISVHTYGGHAGGNDEMQQITQWLTALPYSQWRVGHYHLCNKTTHQESLFLLQKIVKNNPA